jgi:hypothetical protein
VHRRGTLLVQSSLSTIQANSSRPARDRPIDRETFDATILTFKNRRPFRPFALSLASGERLGHN